MPNQPLIAVLAAAAALALGGLAAARAASPPAPAIAAAVADAGRPAADTARDPARKPAEMMVFAKVRPGEVVGELLPGGGYFTRIFSKAVGPAGKVYAYLPSEAPDKMAEAITALAADPAYANVVVLRQPLAGFAPPQALDLVWTSQNYHDLHNNGADPAVINAAVFKALKPGGYYVIVDHVAAAGTGVAETNTLHRIDPAAVKAEVLKAGFVLDGSSDVLHRADDPHTEKVFTLHDRTDQFAFRFRKPN